MNDQIRPATTPRLLPESDVQPLYLFADSQLLFWKDGNTRFLDSIVGPAVQGSSKAAYVGASNGDQPEFYSLFETALAGVGMRDCRMIRSSFGSEDRSFLAEADLILLAGGNVETGWHTIKRTGMDALVVDRYRAGAIVIGVSAGAMQLGLHGICERPDSSMQLIDTFGLVPLIIGAHDERQEWQQLTSVIQLLEGKASGVGIPTGGGILYHPDDSIEAIRYPADAISVSGGRIVRDLLLPQDFAVRADA